MTTLRDHLISSSIVTKDVLDLLSVKSKYVTKTDVEKKIMSSIAIIMTSGPKMYRVYTIPKKNGGRRTIAHPSKILKIIQRGLVEFLTDKLPIHKAAFAYRKGISIKDNAFQHVNNSFFLRMDLADFFNSIDVNLFDKQLEKNKIMLTPWDHTFIRRCAFWSPKKINSGNLILSVGAPSSPLVSNFIMNSFDKMVVSVCEPLNVKYTRYADDLFFSTNQRGVLFEIPSMIKYILSIEFDEKIVTNDIKTNYSSKAHNRHITGITIANDQTLSIGRERKRLISSMIHKHSLGVFSEKELAKLQGLLSFALHIEPLFVERMNEKYSCSLISDIISGHWRK